MTEMRMVLAPSGELHAVIHLLTGFLNDLTPEPDRAEDVEVPAEIISALADLAQTLMPKNDEEIAEISFMLETLDALKRDYYGGKNDKRKEETSEAIS